MNKMQDGIGVNKKDENSCNWAWFYGKTKNSFVKRKFTEELNEKEQIDCAFVCTSPLSHAKIIKNCLENGWNVFSEINLTEDGYHENMAFTLAKKKVLFLSSTPLYREEMKAIKDVVTKIINRFVIFIMWGSIYRTGIHGNGIRISLWEIERQVGAENCLRLNCPG